MLLDEYGGPAGEQSALNLIYLLGTDDSAASGRQPKNYPVLSATDEKWHIREGNDQLIRGCGNLHFAGEHTSVNFQGYMEGALRSGYRCAAEIAGPTPS